jgi:hypothetical protein
MPWSSGCARGCRRCRRRRSDLAAGHQLGFLDRALDGQHGGLDVRPPRRFFRPREGWLPMPITSIAALGWLSPTIATILEVPISSPTIVSLALRLAIVRLSLVRCREPSGAAGASRRRSRGCSAGRRSRPRPRGREQRRGDARETPQAGLEVLAPRRSSTPLLSSMRHEPRASSSSARRPKPDRGEGRARVQVAARHQPLAALRPVQARQLGRHVARVAHEQLAAGVQQAALAPARGGHLLDHDDLQLGRPAPAHHASSTQSMATIRSRTASSRTLRKPVSRRSPTAASTCSTLTRSNGPCTTTWRIGRSSTAPRPTAPPERAERLAASRESRRSAPAIAATAGRAARGSRHG